ncbi:MAG: imidazolonepropionase [Bacteroidales bacterium]|jgi:imidazolonepropionase|nr:imidazolonepropionase [Bacteroidales bacterium]
MLITNIKQLLCTEKTPRLQVYGKEMSELGMVENAFLQVENGIIFAFGGMADAPKDYSDEIINATDRIVMPAFCDSHTHIVYAGSREIEYIDKIRGLSYEEIAQRGGGILNSAKLLANTSEEALFEAAKNRLDEMMSYGTGAAEIKSGYGLFPEEELKMLRVIRRLKNESKIKIKATLLIAHAVPAEYKGRQNEYVDRMLNDLLPRVADEKLADFIDVFCDKGFFTVEETDKILNVAAKYGLVPKIHANELDFSGGVQIGVKHRALSVDHLEYISDAEIEVLRNSGTMPTILPGAAFFLGMPLSPVRKMIDAGLPIAMASDFNPGSSPSGNMLFVMSLVCIRYKMLPEEAIYAVTLNSAYAMGISDKYGSIATGKKAHLIITKKIANYQYLPYSFGNNKVEQLIIA